MLQCDCLVFVVVLLCIGFFVVQLEIGGYVEDFDGRIGFEDGGDDFLGGVMWQIVECGIELVLVDFFLFYQCWQIQYEEMWKYVVYWFVGMGVGCKCGDFDMWMLCQQVYSICVGVVGGVENVDFF